jgi:hypothetical protein
MFEPKGAAKPDALEYVLFGTPSELFLAHAIFGPPDFDHVLSVTLPGRALTAQELAGDLRVTLPDRKNVSAARLRDRDRAKATLRIGDAASTEPIEVEAGPVFYFEEGELMMPPTFDPTAEEKKP